MFGTQSGSGLFSFASSSMALHDRAFNLNPSQHYLHGDIEKGSPDETKRRIHSSSYTITHQRQGLQNPRALFFLALWYFFSLCTLFLNKYILSYMKGDPAFLGGAQMIMTTVCGFFQLFFPCGMYKPIKRLGKPPNFFRNMILVGSMRFSTVVLGLVSLKYVAVSFTETIKSSAPLFTVFISRAITGEQSGILVIMSTIPIVGGLFLCSANELSFDSRGFAAAIATNLTECLQNVYSKVLISGEKYRYTPAELQFYTSMASLFVQIPLAFVLIDWSDFAPSFHLVSSYLLNGLFFHFQSITAYVLMDYISPVTHSVANTAKRALLIWLSIFCFGNEVTLWSGLGTMIVFVGVFLYNQAKSIENRESYGSSVVGKNESDLAPSVLIIPPLSPEMAQAAIKQL